MVFQIVAPKLGMSMSDVKIVEWKAKEGERVEKDGVVLVIETEKTEWNVEAQAEGFLHIVAKEGVKAKIGQVVGLIAETRDELKNLQKQRPDESISVERTPASLQTASMTVQTVNPDEGGRIRISPLARKMAEEHMLDIMKISGTGPEGRIVKEDVEKAIEEQKSGAQADAGAIYQGRRLKERITLKGMRRAIAERMCSSLSNSAQLSFLGEFDSTALMSFREALLRRQNEIGAKITYTEMLVYALSKALKRHADINVSLIENEIHVWEDINVGFAVAIGKEGLLVPVVKRADTKSLFEISEEVKRLTDKVRSGKILPDEVTGGTFTLTSMGSVGVSYFQTPVINPPESAILGTGPILEKPVVRNGRIVVASMMPYSLTVDHRVINGFGAEQFLITLKELVETPGLLSIA